MSAGRNAPCPCGSGKKSKHCCQRESGQHVHMLPTAFNELIALFQSGRYAEMEGQARLLVERHPESGMAWKLYGTSLGVQGKDAVFSLQQAAKRLPDDLEVQVNLGNVLQEAGKLDEALICYRRALTLNPAIPEIHNNLGNVLKDQGRFDAAMASYRRALELHPHCVEAHSNLGVTLQELGRLDEAMASFRQALSIHPDFVEALDNLGNALKACGRFDEALACFQQVLNLQPHHSETHNNLGVTLEASGQPEAAVPCFQQALKISPDYTDAHSNLAHVLLGLGQFERGWQEYEWRYSRDAANVPMPSARSPLPFTAAGKRILLCFEQGIGDELFFLRFAPQLRQEAQWVGYWSTPKVQSLIERSGCVDQVLSRHEDSSQIDLVIPVGDLPFLLGCNSVAHIPPALRFSPTPQVVEQVRHHLNELGLGSQRLLGLTWRGGSAPVPGKRRTLFKQIDLGVLADAIKDWQGAIVVLQRLPQAGEIEQLQSRVNCPVHDFSQYNDDLEWMLALLDELDEYVGVSNANMHLMAGLGKTARVLIPSPAEWRWMASGDQSPWFPGYALFRETVEAGWRPALDALRAEILSNGVD